MPDLIPSPAHTFVETDHKIFNLLYGNSPTLFSTDLGRAGKYGHLVLVIRFGILSLPRNSVVRFSDRPDLTIANDQ